MPDVPDAVKQPWIEYRQKLRDLPTDWADVGNSTYLIQWLWNPMSLQGVSSMVLVLKMVLPPDLNKNR